MMSQKHPRHSLVAQGHSRWDPSKSRWHWLSWTPLTAKATPLGRACNSYALKPTPSSYTLRRISQWTEVAWRPYNKLRYINQIRRILNKCNISILPNWSSFQLTETHGKVPVPAAWQHTICLQIKQIDVPAGTIQPTHQLLVRNAHSAAESVLPSSACAAIYGVMSHVHISNTPSTNVIVELDGLLQPSIYINSSVETFCVLAVTTHNFVRIPQWNITEMKFTYRVWPKLYLWSRLYRCRDICPKQLQQI